MTERVDQAGGVAGRGGAQVVPRPDDWRPGGPAPWVVRDADAGWSSADAVAGAVRASPWVEAAPPLAGARPSAVLVAVFDGDDGAEVVLTRRSRHLRQHRGEISFPGGRLEPGETPEAGALREAHEEVALDPSSVRLVGRLPTLSTVVSLSHIVPIVGRLDTRPALWPAVGEVERILHVPLAELAQPEIFREERWGSPPFERAVYFFELDDETIWGATARIIVDLLRVVLGVSA